ncbi:hypothetical protein FS837_000895 [Tulasnella sp. UAMH 9824]|nr:hypothetical protein FS837_000895 [Tulasnella sp. UAMH 9824]
MSSESDSIVFTGVEGLSCHQLIRAIREHALEAGKQRDDQWMADYASIRFDGEALKWFESLEDDTQSDWKLLRRAILARYAEPVYEESARREPESEQRSNVLALAGKNKEDCRQFVQSIRLRAEAEGKINDPRWMCQIAYPRFAGEALEWHASLPTDVKNDWYRLERAILIDFPRQATLSLTPARILIDNWWSAIPSSAELRSLKSRDQWLNQARERRRMYVEAADRSIPCWLLVENVQDIPENAVETGASGDDKPTYSARAWQGDAGLIVGKVARGDKGVFIALNSEEVGSITSDERFVGDRSHFKWVAVPDKPADYRAIASASFAGVEAGFESAHRHRATFISRIWLDDTWQPGKGHSDATFVLAGFYGKERWSHAVQVLAWAN